MLVIDVVGMALAVWAMAGETLPKKALIASVGGGETLRTPAGKGQAADAGSGRGSTAICAGPHRHHPAGIVLHGAATLCSAPALVGPASTGMMLVMVVVVAALTE